jgi:outer membrane translocation and assembly module TamA
MSLSSSSLRALTQNDLNRTASETTVCSKRKIESCESIFSSKRQKTVFCCLSKTHSIDTLSSTIIKHARISLVSLLSLFSLDQTSHFLKKKRERSRVEKTSETPKNKNERSRKLDQASQKEKKMSQKRDRATQKNRDKERSRKYNRASRKKNERSQQIDFTRASNLNLDRKIAQIMKNTKMTRQHETILKRRLRERIDRKTRHARQCARIIRRDDTSLNTITQTSQSLRDIVSFSSRQDNSFFSNHSESSVVLVQNSVDYRTCVRCDLLRSTSRFLASFDDEYCD